MHQALDGKTEDRLVGADGVAARHDAAGLGHHRRGGTEDGAHHLDRQPLREGRDVEREHDPPSHGEDVAARVRGGDGTEVGRIVDEWREEVRGRHDRGVRAQAVNRGVVERRQTDEQVAVDRPCERLDQRVQRRRAPLRGATAARRPFGQLDRHSRSITRA